MPYTHGRLVARAHAEGEVISEEHTGGGHPAQGAGARGAGRGARAVRARRAALTPSASHGAAETAGGRPALCGNAGGGPSRVRRRARAAVPARCELLAHRVEHALRLRAQPRARQPAAPSPDRSTCCDTSAGLPSEPVANQPPPEEPPVMVQPMRYIVGVRGAEREPARLVRCTGTAVSTVVGRRGRVAASPRCVLDLAARPGRRSRTGSAAPTVSSSDLPAALLRRHVQHREVVRRRP